jgi:hypothetical protein
MLDFATFQNSPKQNFNLSNRSFLLFPPRRINGDNVITIAIHQGNRYRVMHAVVGNIGGTAYVFAKGTRDGL